MVRVYRHYLEWEEIHYNMWGTVDNKKLWLQAAIAFTGNHSLYGYFMIRVINEWPVSCENALTDININKKAWVGHAATALGIGCPEDITRQAWGYLTNEQRILANKEAQRAIDTWENVYRENNQLYQDMGKQMLS